MNDAIHNVNGRQVQNNANEIESPTDQNGGNDFKPIACSGQHDAQGIPA